MIQNYTCMKFYTILFFFASQFFFFKVYSQDLITFKDGTQLNVSVLELTNEEVIYKKTGASDEAKHRCKRAEVKIRYGTVVQPSAGTNAGKNVEHAHSATGSFSNSKAKPAQQAGKAQEPARQTLPENKIAPLPDKLAPSLSILSPAIAGIPLRSTEKFLIVKGKTTDANGIYEVVVNGLDAAVESSGLFTARIPLVVGENQIVVKASDVAQNIKEIKFIVLRISEQAPIVEEKVEDRHGPEIAAQITQQLKLRKNFALIIGVEDYSDKNINDLDQPVKDATALKAILEQQYTFEGEDVFLLPNPDRASIIHAFDKLARTVTPADNLLIFYAGHGVWDGQMKKGYWLPRNAEKDDRSNWFSNSDLRDYIGGINSKHTLLIADACFSGSIFKTRDAFTGTTSTAALELFKLPSRQAMTSGAMKSVPDKSIFMEYLLKRLKENQQAFLSAEQLFSSFKIAVINNSPNGQIPQFGEIKEAGDEGGDFIFIKK